MEEYFKEHAELFCPNPAEEAILRLHESGVEFRTVAPVGISEGRQSRVSILEYEVAGEVRRVIWKRMGAGKALTEQEARLLHSRLLPYRTALKDAGWNMPEIFYTDVVAMGGEYQIFSYEQLVGRGDGDKMLTNPQEPNFRKWHMLRRTMETLVQYAPASIIREKLAGQEVSRLPHGLDLKTANVVLDGAGIFWFVDLFGPKELNAEGGWKTFSLKLDSLEQEKLLAVCASREGMALRMYRLAEKAWLSAGGIEVDTLRKNFIALLESLDLPRQEVSFMVDQIRQDFPWLNSIYEERKV